MIKKTLYKFRFGAPFFGAFLFYELFKFKLGYTSGEIIAFVILAVVVTLFRYIQLCLPTSQEKPFDPKYVFWFVVGILVCYNQDIMGGDAWLFFKG